MATCRAPTPENSYRWVGDPISLTSQWLFLSRSLRANTCVPTWLLLNQPALQFPGLRASRASRLLWRAGAR